MGPVQPVGTSISGTQQTPVTNQVTPSPTTATASVGAAGATTSTTTVSSVRATSVYAQVDAMLAAVGGSVQNNELLRMIIGLLILQVLMGADGGGQESAAGALLGMLAQADAGRQGGVASLHSATNVVQIQQQSTVLTTSQAVLSPTATEGGPNNPGSQVDVEA